MDVFDLVAKIRLDSSEYESGVGKAKGTFSNLASGVKTGLATVAKVGGAAIAAGVAGVTALTKMGVEGYAQYEQLTGGVETLFGKSSKKVMAYAENAYKTAGMSANQYMETVTSFSASLLQGLDGNTAKAAKVANTAITDMSDNANKMGTSMELIQNAYNGFAKGNYTMLDNLKLGFGGTKSEMMRLVKESGVLGKASKDLTLKNFDQKVSFDQIIAAIHATQEKMGIAGTTSKEAATTIEGSLTMMKGAWQNLVVGIADENADFGELVDNFVESVGIAAENIIPRVEEALHGIDALIYKMTPVIADAIPKVVEALLPTIITAAINLITSLANALVTALPAIKDALMEGLVIILTEVFGVSEDKARGFVDGLNSAFAKIKDGFMALVKSAQTEGTFLNKVWTGLQETGRIFGECVSAIWTTISTAFTWAVEQINTDGTSLNKIWTGLQKAFLFVQAALNTAFESVTTAFNWAVEQISTDGTTLNNLWEFIKETCVVVGNALKLVWEGVSAAFTWCAEQINTEGTFLNNLWLGIQEAAQVLGETLANIWDYIYFAIAWAIDQINTEGTFLNEVWQGLQNALQALKDFFIDAWNWIKDAFSACVKSAQTEGGYLNNLWNELKETGQALKDFFVAAWEFMKKVFAACVKSFQTEGGYLNSVWTNLQNTVKLLKEVFVAVWEGMKTSVSTTISNIKNIINAFTSALKGDWSGVWDNIKKTFSNTWNAIIKTAKDAVAVLKKAFDFEWKLPKLKLPHISVSGGKAPYGIGGKGSLPSFNIKWYKKAYDNAMLLSNPTIFGYSNGNLLGGGDGNGNEIVAGESYLMGMIGHVVESKIAQQNEKIVSLLSDLLKVTACGNEEMVRALMSDRTFAVGEREFARLVKTYA